MDRRLKALIGLAFLGCVAGGCAAAGGSGTLIGGVLSVVVLLLFCLLYQIGHLGPQLPPVRVSRTVLVRVWRILMAILLALIVLAAVRLLSLHAPPG